MSKRRNDSPRPRKRRPGTQPLKDAKPDSTGGKVIHRKMTPDQLREYRRTGVAPPSAKIPVVGVTPADWSSPRLTTGHAWRLPFPVPPADRSSRFPEDADGVLPGGQLALDPPDPRSLPAGTA